MSVRPLICARKLLQFMFSSKDMSNVNFGVRVRTLSGSKDMSVT